MKVLFVTGHKYFPQTYGGVQTSTDQLCVSLMKRGHQVAVLAGFMHGGWFALKCRLWMKVNQSLHGCAVVRGMHFGYPVWRSWFPWAAVEYVGQRESPDVIVVSSGLIARMGRAAKPLGIPLLLHFHDAAFFEHGGPFEDLGKLPAVANSNFTARKYQETYGIDSTVIYPFIEHDRYRVASARRNVTFINPHPLKGRDIAIEIARRCPHIPFVFVEGWALSDVLRRELDAQINTLRNVTFIPPHEDMREVYGQAKILLAPSVREEEYGRVATEAQISGIPVVASNRGGLPESVGPGGVLLDPEGPIEAWVDAVQALWSDEEHYAALSAAALAYAQRPEVSLNWQIEAHERALLAVLK